jgi:hypothetical protein
MPTIVIALCSLQGICDIGNAGAGAQSVRELIIQDIDNGSERIRYTEPMVSACTDLNVVSSASGLSHAVEGRADSGELGTDNSDYLASDERYDWCSGYALYRYTLEVNGVEEVQTSQWERTLRSYCASEAKSKGRRSTDSTERQTNNGNWRAIFDSPFASQAESRQFVFVDFQNREIAGACKPIHWGRYFGGYGVSVSRYADHNVPILRQGISIGYDVERSDDPTVGTNNKSSSVHGLGVDLDYGLFEASAGFDMGKWQWESLTPNCGASKEQYEHAVQFQDATPLRGSALEATQY